MEESRVALLRGIIAKWMAGRLFNPPPWATANFLPDGYYYEIDENEDGCLFIDIAPADEEEVASGLLHRVEGMDPRHEESRVALLRSIIATWKAGRLLDPPPNATANFLHGYYYEIDEKEDGSLFIDIAPAEVA